MDRANVILEIILQLLDRLFFYFQNTVTKIIHIFKTNSQPVAFGHCLKTLQLEGTTFQEKRVLKTSN